MSHEQLVARFAEFVSELAEVAAQDEVLRESLRKLLRAIETEPASIATPEASEPSVERIDEGAGQVEVLTPLPAPDSIEESRTSLVEPLPRLTLGQAVGGEGAGTRVPAPRRSEEGPVDLELVARRCRIKADGARWAHERRQLLLKGAVYVTAIEPMDRAIIERAKEVPDCFLWMCHPSCPTPDRSADWLDIAAYFDALASSCELANKVGEEWNNQGQEQVDLLKLLAEAQSGLRVAVSRLGANVDHDQIAAFNWLKVTTLEKQIFVARHMRLDDPADLARLEALTQELDQLAQRWDSVRERDKQRRKLLNKIKHKVKVISENVEDRIEEFRILVATVETLIEQGLPASNRELRESLLPMIDLIPDSEPLPAGFQRVLREVDAYLSANAHDDDGDLQAHSSVSQELIQCARLLAGKKVVLIGGQRRPGSHEALREALNVTEVIWIETREHQSIENFEPYVARGDVAVVLLAIRWASHSFGDVKDFCDRYGKPLVRLPGGYNPNQVAVQILQQCSDRLRAVAG